MSASNTYRFFLNNKRVSTAVKVKDGKFLQVYPQKCWFPTEEHWRKHWVEVSQPMMHVEAPLQKEPVPTVKRAQKEPKAVKESDWTFQENISVHTVPPGKYYIGDLCYVLSDAVYDTIFGRLGFYEEGLYSEKENPKHFFFLNHTFAGDGTYEGSDGNAFSVDAGIIGICPEALMEKDDGGGHVYEFKDSVRCIFREGTFLFQKKQTGEVLLKIETS